MSDNDATVGAVLGGIDILVRQVPWRVVPAKKRAGKKWAKFLEECLDDMSSTWSEFISEVFTMITYGFAPFEILYKVRAGPDQPRSEMRSDYNDGLIGWRKFEIRGQESIRRWEISPDGSILGCWQTPQNFGGGEVFIPIEKMLLFRTRTHQNNPEGRSFLRNAYRSWWALKRAEEIQMIGHDRNLNGIPVLEVPPQIMNPNASGDYATQRAQFQKFVEDIRVDDQTGVLIPSETDPMTGQPTGYKLKLLSSGAKDLNSIQSVVLDRKHDLAATAQAGFVMVGRSGAGSYAADKNKSSFFMLTLKALIASVQDVLNRFAVSRLMRLNNVPRDLWPTIEHGEIVQAALQEIATYVAAMSDRLAHDLATENELRRRANLPVIDEEQQEPRGQLMTNVPGLSSDRGRPQEPSEDSEEISEDE